MLTRSAKLKHMMILWQKEGVEISTDSKNSTGIKKKI